MKKALAILFLVPSLALADVHNKPKPPPIKSPAPSGDNTSGLAAVAIAAGIVGFAVWESNERNKKVTLAPTTDGKGATASVQWRF